MRRGMQRKITGGGRGDGEIRSAAIRRALSYLRPHRLTVIAALVCLLVGSLLTLAPFLIVERVINQLGHPNGSFLTIVLLGFVGLGVVIVAGLIGVLRTWLVLRITTAVVADLRLQLVRRLLGQSVSYFTSARGAS